MTRSKLSLALAALVCVLLLVLISGVACERAVSESDSMTSRESAEAGAGPAGEALAADTMRDGVAKALSLHDPLDRTTQLVDLLRRLDAQNVEGAAAAYDAAAKGIEAFDVALFANAWARIDGEAALDRMIRFPDPAGLFRGVAEVIFLRARRGDAAAVREYAERAIAGQAELSVEDKQTAANIILDATARGLAAAGQHDELTKLLESLPSSRERSFLITKTIVELGRNDGDSRRWAESISWDAKNDLKHDVLRPVLVTMMNWDSATAAKWYDASRDRLEPGEWLGELTEAWSPNDPVAAIEWLLAQPPSDPRAMGLRTAAYNLLRKDGPQGREWIEKRLSEPDVHAHMLFPLVQYIISVDIHQALPLAREIEGEGDKIAALKQILMIWSRRDYDAVQKYMAEVGVPPQVKEAVIGHNEIRIQRRREQEAAANAAAKKG